MKENTFGFVLHPLDPRRDAGRKYPFLVHLPVWLIEFLSVFAPPILLSEVRGIRSPANGRDLRGWFVACPLSARMMLKLPTGIVYHKIVQSAQLAQSLGARIVGLGAFTSVVGDGGVSVARKLRVPVTTGNSYTIATAIHAVRLSARLAGIDLSEATVAVVGASGSIGAICARLMAAESGAMLLIGRRLPALQEIAERASESGAHSVRIGTDVSLISEAQIVIAVTSSLSAIIDTQHLGPGAIVCDVARPRDVARRVTCERPDVHVIEGGAVSVPGDVDFRFDFGFPAGMAYACMAETMALALEGRFESFSLGKQLELDRVAEIDRLASRHGFRVSGLRNLDRVIQAPALDGAGIGAVRVANVPVRPSKSGVARLPGIA